MNLAPMRPGRKPLLLALLAASVVACGPRDAGPESTSGAPPAGSVTTIDGYALGPVRTLNGAQFHRLEATARSGWNATHPGEILSGFEVRTPAGPAPLTSGALPLGPDDFLVVVTVAGAGQHVVAVHCNPATFPAPGSCS
jgi:hypothetical protein